MQEYMELESIIKDKERIKYNEPMKNHTSVKIGGPCKVMVLPESIDEISDVLKFVKSRNIKYYVIGLGSNLLVSDDGFDGVIIKITNKFSKVEVIDNKIIAYAGASMPLVSRIALKSSLSGFEFACGIPGTIGGGVRMNAGAYGSEIKEIIESITYLDDNEDVVTISSDDAKFSYRHSMFCDNPNFVILQATFKLQMGEKEKIEEKMKENSLARTTKQPLEYPNFGSAFKRPEGYFVGKLIQDAGLRGYQIGGAQVSTKHTGFIVNVKDATCKDVVNLIKHIQDVVYEKDGVLLEPEVVFLRGV